MSTWFTSELRGAASAVAGMRLPAYVASDQTSVTTKSTRGAANIRAVTPPPTNNETLR